MSDETVPARPNPGIPVGPAVIAAGAGGSSTSLACYFRKGADVTWRWGLNADDSWFALPGSWGKTPYTRLEKFFTSTSPDEIAAAAAHARRYYGLDGYSVLAVFAADSSAGSNYPIVVGGTELSSKW